MATRRLKRPRDPLQLGKLIVNIATGVALSLGVGVAQAASNGTWLCSSPVIANNLWTDISAVHETGVQLTKSMIDSMAAKNGCRFVASQNLKPVNFVAGQFLLVDGNAKGWASPFLYIWYVNTAPY